VAVSGDNARARFASADAGTHAVTITGFELVNNGKDNYVLLQPEGITGVIRRAPLVVRAADAVRYYGEKNPEFIVVYEYFAEGDGPEVLSGSVTVVTDADDASLPGRYALVPVGALTAANYEISFEPGVLTVLPVPLVHLIPSADLQQAYLAALADAYRTALAGAQGFGAGQGPGDVDGGSLLEVPGDEDPDAASPGSAHPEPAAE